MFERVVKSHLGLGADDTAFTLTVDDLQLKSKYEDKFIPEKELQDLVNTIVELYTRAHKH